MKYLYSWGILAPDAQSFMSLTASLLLQRVALVVEQFAFMNWQSYTPLTEAGTPEFSKARVGVRITEQVHTTVIQVFVEHW